MTREDWLWLLLKAAGLWLLVTAVEVMAMPDWSWYDYGEADTAGREQLLRVLVPLAAGLSLLLVDFARWLPVVPPKPAVPAEPFGPAEPAEPPKPSDPSELVEQPERVATMARSDWLWVGLKLVGAWYATTMVLYLGQFALVTSGGISEWGLAVVGPAVTLSISLWMLFGDRIWHVATRDATARDGTPESRTRGRARKFQQARDVVFVVMVFAILAAIPLVVLWWFGGRD